ncbi:forkhead box protein H1-like [Gambusia affinis]|uniref:forkhead box protein H1-like n=1 Tax=Gambusia affinis TaxID=33528 RepID=UPI001CDCB99E|nr:forkhead box protein H1-like [Gambusia affinis]XP_043994330.1 forkhead box protein H1-like [Gambusia affinis]XP_043994331.1 forkhead box protein H1-like [Gambusia affinis]
MRDNEAEFCHPVPVGITERAAFKWATTFLSKIAIILRNAPNWMLTFTQLMDRLMLLMSRDRKYLENNIRVCLSSHSCFTKVPVIPNSLKRNKNFWKLDCSQITAKMVRRHFGGLLLYFPELASKLETEKLDSALPSPQPASRRAVQVRCEVKFTGPFSVESLLKRDSPPSQTSTASHLSGMEQQPLPTTPKRDFIRYPVEPVILQSSNCFSHIGSAGGSTDHTLIANGAVQPIRWIPVHNDPSSAPYFTGAQHSFITYSAPMFTEVASHVWQ